MANSRHEYEVLKSNLGSANKTSHTTRLRINTDSSWIDRLVHVTPCILASVELHAGNVDYPGLNY